MGVLYDHPLKWRSYNGARIAQQDFCSRRVLVGSDPEPEASFPLLLALATAWVQQWEAFVSVRPSDRRWLADVDIRCLTALRDVEGNQTLRGMTDHILRELHLVDVNHGEIVRASRRVRGRDEMETHIF